MVSSKKFYWLKIPPHFPCDTLICPSLQFYDTHIPKKILFLGKISTMPPKQHSDYKYIQALLNNETETIKLIYQRFRPHCINLVTKNSGTINDGKDLFQKTLLAVTLHVRKRSDFVLSAPFGGFLRGVYSRLWLRELKKRKRNDDIINQLKAYIDNESNNLEIKDFDEIDEHQEILDKLLKKLKKMSKICQTILKLIYWQGLKPRDIAKKLDVTANLISVRKKRCLKFLGEQM